MKVNHTSSTAALTGTGVTVVRVNSDDPRRQVTLDLSRFASVRPDATVTPVVTTYGEMLEQRPVVPVTGGSATVTVPAKSVTTLLVEGVHDVARVASEIQRGVPHELEGVQSGKLLTLDGDEVVISAPRGAEETALAVHPSGRHAVQQPRALHHRDRRGRSPAHGGRHGPAPDRCTALTPVRLLDALTTGDGSWTMVNVGSRGLVDVGGQATHDGAPVSTWYANSGANQLWRLRAVQPE